MSNIITLGLNSPRPMIMNPVQRSVYFGLGFGLIVAGLIAAPVSTLWFAAVNMLGIALVTTSIIGRGVRFSRVSLRGRKIGTIIQPIANMATGLVVSIGALAAISSLTPAWFIVAQLVAVALMFSALLNLEYTMTEEQYAEVNSITAVEDDDWILPQAA